MMDTSVYAFLAVATVIGALMAGAPPAAMLSVRRAAKAGFRSKSEGDLLVRNLAIRVGLVQAAGASAFLTLGSALPGPYRVTTAWGLALTFFTIVLILGTILSLFWRQVLGAQVRRHNRGSSAILDGHREAGGDS